MWLQGKARLGDIGPASGTEERDEGLGCNIRESLDEVVLVANLAALVFGMLLRGGDLVSRRIGLAGDLFK